MGPVESVEFGESGGPGDFVDSEKYSYSVEVGNSGKSVESGDYKKV